VVSSSGGTCSSTWVLMPVDSVDTSRRKSPPVKQRAAAGLARNVRDHVVGLTNRDRMSGLTRMGRAS